MAISTHTTTLTRRAVARFLALAPMVTVPVAVAAASEGMCVMHTPSDPETNESVEAELLAMLNARWPGSRVEFYHEGDKRRSFGVGISR